MGLAVPAPNNSQQAGAWPVLDYRVEVQVSKDTRLLIAQHTAIGTIAEERGALRWTIEWTAPEVATTSIRFNLVGNRSNDDACLSANLAEFTSTPPSAKTLTRLAA